MGGSSESCAATVFRAALARPRYSVAFVAAAPLPYIVAMYRLCFQRAFSARHFLLESSGPESMPHAHAYRIEWELQAPELDAHGYLVDLVEVEKSLGRTLARYEGAFLNELAEFKGSNPSLERFVRILWERLSTDLSARTSCAVRLWENDSAWAGYEAPAHARG